jgi:hypothetical protein
MPGPGASPTREGKLRRPMADFEETIPSGLKPISFLRLLPHE